MNRRTAIRTALLSAALALGASAARAALCSADRVPAGTLLFPFLRGTYAASANAIRPVADRTAPHSVISVTNVASTPRIANFVLSNDMGYPLLHWNALLTGYDVVTYDFADLMEGKIRPTGPGVDPATGTPYSPTGGTPLPFGPLPGFDLSTPPLPSPGGIGSAGSGIYGLCNDPAYASALGVDPDIYRQGLPRVDRAHVFSGLRQSRWMAATWMWSDTPPYYVSPEWLRSRTLDGEIWASLTVDVVDACTGKTPRDGSSYFATYARPRTTSKYAADPAGTVDVGLGNVLLGQFREITSASPIGPSGNAVAVEIDNQDVWSYRRPRPVSNGASFYRYTPELCPPMDEPAQLETCRWPTSVQTRGSEYMAGSTAIFGPARPIPSGDFREPLPSAFAIRWIEDPASSTSTKIRVWREYGDVYPYYGYGYVFSGLGYAYYVWDDEERVVGSPSCPIPPCQPFDGGGNLLPLPLQEVDLADFSLPTSLLKSGWMVLAFYGSATYGMPIPGGYSSPSPNTEGTMAWIDVHVVSGGSESVAPAQPVGNFLCDGFAVGPNFPGSDNRLDLGNILY